MLLRSFALNVTVTIFLVFSKGLNYLPSASQAVLLYILRRDKTQHDTTKKKIHNKRHDVFGFAKLTSHIGSVFFFLLISCFAAQKKKYTNLAPARHPPPPSSRVLKFPAALRCFQQLVNYFSHTYLLPCQQVQFTSHKTIFSRYWSVYFRLSPRGGGGFPLGAAPHPPQARL